VEKSRINRILLRFVFSFLVAILAPCIALNRASAEQAKSLDILIIYSTGNPFKTISDMEAHEVDAITTPTPAEENCGSIANKLTVALQDKKLLVRVAKATQIEHHNEILSARLVVLGSPAYFGNVSWQIKKLLDEKISRICGKRKDGLARQRIAAFSMAEIEESAQDVIQVINTAIRMCQGRLGPTMTFLTKHSKRELKQRIDRFANQLAAVVWSEYSRQ